MPPPGNYELAVMGDVGRMTLSTVSRAKVARWSPGPRFIDEEREARKLPGPGDYTPNPPVSSKYRAPGGIRLVPDYMKNLKKVTVGKYILTILRHM